MCKSVFSVIGPKEILRYDTSQPWFTLGNIISIKVNEYICFKFIYLFLNWQPHTSCFLLNIFAAFFKQTLKF